MAELEAPSGCKQYFMKSYSNVKSFNYDGLSKFGPNQDYTICFAGLGSGRRTCGITLRSIAFGMPIDVATNIDSGKGTREPAKCARGTDVAIKDWECCTGVYSSFLGV